MALYNKFNQTIADAFNKVHDLSADTIKVALTNTAPIATNTLFSDITEISTGNGYTSGGEVITITSSSQIGGVYTAAANETITITASGGTIGPFRYIVCYNDTPTSPADPLISFYDYGSSVTLNDGESFDIVVDTSLFTAA